MVWCPAESFFDPFLDADFERHWQDFTEKGSCTLTFGTGFFEIGAGPTSGCARRTRRSFDPTGQTFMLLLSDGVYAGTDSVRGLRLMHPWDFNVPTLHIAHTHNGLAFGRSDATNNALGIYAPAYLQIVQSGGNYEFYYSTDGVTFNLLGSEPAPVGLDHAQLEVFLSVDDASATENTQRFYQINWPP
jgi:hypothetical protein